nr:hypothetical protein [Clostridia bacterium]
MTRLHGSAESKFSVGGYAILALCIVAAGWLAPYLEKHGYPSWAIVLRFVGIAGGILSLIVAYT